MAATLNMDTHTGHSSLAKFVKRKAPWLVSRLFLDWSKTGKTEFNTKCKELLTSTNYSRRIKDDEILVDAVSQLVVAGLDKVIRREDVVAEIKQLLVLSPSRFASVLSDAWAGVDSITYCRSQDARRDAFIQLSKDISSTYYYLIQEKSEAETMGEFGMLTGAEVKLFNQKIIRLKTKTYYKQQKFNLFREEPEGYGKLIAELAKPLDGTKHLFMLNTIRGLIGTCYLDPNRVIDIILEAFECEPNCDFFIPLLQNLKPTTNTVCEILAFKLNEVDSSRYLFNVMALLLQHDIISLDHIYPWLKPDNRVIEKNWERQMNEASIYASGAMKVRLDGSKEANGVAAFIDEEDNAVEERSTYYDNHKILLCKALLDVGAWNIARDLLERHPKYSIVSCAPVARSFVRLYNYMLDPIYNMISDLPARRKARRPYHASSNSEIPSQIHDYDDLEESIDMLLILGPYIHCDPILMYKVLRVIRFYLEGVEGKAKTEIYYTFIDLFDQTLLPAMCYLDGNCAMAKEVWSVLEYYPYSIRFRLYGSWKSEERARCHPTLIRKRVDTLKQVKQMMRRLSKENVKFMGRQLGKLSHSIPAIVFDYILTQIQLFDNLIVPVIDALKYLTPLGYDILGYCLLEALSPAAIDPMTRQSHDLTVMLTANRPRTKHDGSTIAPWIQSLAVFTGTICKKYSLDIVPVLQYIANQLKAKESLDLLLLKEIVQRMSGIEAAEDITTDQLEAMCGGELLKSEAGYFGQLRTAKKSATRLRESTAQNDLAMTLCILMAQQRNRIIFDEAQVELHTKLVGKLYDQCQDTLVQFGSFLATFCTLDEYAKKIPPIKTLVEEYHMDSDVAFFLWRPIFANNITAKYDDLRRATKAHRKMTPAQLQQVYTAACTFVLDPVVDVMKNFLPLKTWEDISPQFYVTFWSLSLYDLFVPNDAYAREVLRIKQMSQAVCENKDFTSSKRRKEQERCNQLIDKLHDEQQRQVEHVKRVLTKLGNEKESWFAPRTQKSAKNEAVTAFLQLCIFPRCIFTAPDALYCAQFVTTIHLLCTPNFSTLICYDRVFCDIIYTVTSCTENEANRYGRFLNALLSTVMKWHGDKAVFEKECATYPGFVTKFRAANSTAESNDHVDYENYRHVCHKWHYKITKCMIVCLESKEFTQIRNALLVLKRILPSYPRVTNLANAIERWVERVRADQKEKRHDLFALATSYIGQLKAKIPTLISEEAFHKKSNPSKSDLDSKPKAQGTESKGTKSGEPKSAKGTPEPKVDKDSPQHESVETPPPTPMEEIKSPRGALKLEETKVTKAEVKTVKIKLTDVKAETNGSDKVKVSRKIDVKGTPKDKDIKRRKIEGKEQGDLKGTPKESTSNSNSPSVDGKASGTKRHSTNKK